MYCARIVNYDKDQINYAKQYKIAYLFELAIFYTQLYWYANIYWLNDGNFTIKYKKKTIMPEQ